MTPWIVICSPALVGWRAFIIASGERMAAMEQRGSFSTPETPVSNEAYSSGVSWGAIIAGAFAATALSLALLALGTGIGMSEAASWINGRVSSTRIGWTAVVWIVLMQLIASSVGGYLAGRLRTRWVHIHTHEVYFRDTAHGFLVWAVSLVLTAAALGSASSALAGRVEPVSVTLADTADQADTQSALTPGNVGTTGRLDRAYVAAQQAQNAEEARKAIAHSMYWTFVALLVGAFCASVAATFGGKERDRVVVV
jgi:hypothetical protein